MTTATVTEGTKLQPPRYHYQPIYVWESPGDRGGHRTRMLELVVGWGGAS